MNFIKMQKNKLIKGMLLFFLVVMLIYPTASFNGASSGLLLWFHNVLPNLLPFIIVSNLIVRLNISRQISKLFYPILGRLFHVSREGCYPLVIGFLSGLPMGAKTTADLVCEGKISRSEGQFLIAICNNASPMFILGYIAITQLRLPDIKYVILFIIYFSAILAALIFRFINNVSIASLKTEKTTGKLVPSTNAVYTRFHFELLDNSIMNGFEIVTRIGGYIILFSIFAQIMKEAIPGTGYLKALLMGVMEVTNGVSQICTTNLDPKAKIALVCALTSFGGLSSIAQTKSVLQNSRLSLNSYMLVKLIGAIIALLLAFLYVSAFYNH